MPQGGPISAILFIIYLNDYKPANEIAIQLIIYANDVDLWNKYYDLNMHDNIQREIDKFGKYSIF